MEIKQHKVNYYIPPEIAAQLSKSKEAVINGDQDRVFIITGFEGSGKSKLARQLAYYLDPKFSHKDIVFNGTEFKKKVRTIEKFRAIVFDEAFRGLSSRGALSKANKELVRLLQECRQRNLFIFIVLPSIFLLEKYVALFRSHSLFNTAIYKKDYKKRFYKVYNRANKQLLYLLGQKLMSYSRPKINKMWRFYAKEPETIDLEIYEKMKYESFKEEEEVEAEDSTVFLQRTIFSLMLKKTYDVTFVDQAKILSVNNCQVTPQSLSMIAKKHEKTVKVSI